MHFSQVHCELRVLGKLELWETPFNAANLVQEVIEGVQQVIQPNVKASYDAEANDLLHQANAVTAVSTHQTVLLQQMMQR